MRCPKCSNILVSSVVRLYQYRESGLDNVYLGDWVTRHKCQCGESFVEIESMDRLHDAIAYDLLQKTTLLAPKEFRFLRKWVGLTSEKLAFTLGFKKRQTVSRYENGKEPITPATDHAMRLLVLRIKEQAINQRMLQNIQFEEHLEKIVGRSKKQARITIDKERLKNLPFPASSPQCVGG